MTRVGKQGLAWQFTQKGERCPRVTSRTEQSREWWFTQLADGTKVKLAYALCQNCFHKEKEMGQYHRNLFWGEQKAWDADQTHFLGKPG